jgi:indolepyruvate ferredoxin oxidoreductase alpha subunit
MRVRVEERLRAMIPEVSASALNRIEWADKELGIIACGVAYQYVKEVFPEASVLKLGWPYPYPDELIRQFAAGVKRLLVVEELDDFLEEHIKALGIACDGKNFVPNIGELSPMAMRKIRAKMEGKELTQILPVEEASKLPPRPPVLCPSCPHRAVFLRFGQV